MYVSRYICSVLEEMREANKTRNYSQLEGLIEEAQTLANRMESSLEEISQIEKVNEAWKKCKDKDKAMKLLKDHKENRKDVITEAME